MSIGIKSVKTALDTSAQASLSVIQKIVTKPANIKKTLEVAEKTIRGLDYYQGHAHLPVIVTGIGRTISLIGLYDLYNHICFWINPYHSESIDNKENIDRKKLKESLLAQVETEIEPGETFKIPENEPGSEAQLISDFVDDVINQVLNDPEVTSTKEITDRIADELFPTFSKEKAKEIASTISVPFHYQIYTKFALAYCNTIMSMSGVVSAIEKLNIRQYAQLTMTIGTQAPAFPVICKAISDSSLTGIAVLGIVGLACSMHDIYKAQSTLNSASNDEEKEKACKLRNKACWNVATGATALASGVVPMVFVASPGVLMTLSLLSASTGLLKIVAN